MKCNKSSADKHVGMAVSLLSQIMQFYKLNSCFSRFLNKHGKNMFDIDKNQFGRINTVREKDMKDNIPHSQLSHPNQIWYFS